MPVKCFLLIRDAADAAKSEERRLVKEIVLDRLLICLDDITVDEQSETACMLFTVLDADAADTAYRHLGTLEQRTVKKAAEEGGATSAHLLIDLRAKPNSNRYAVALERMEGVSRSRIIPFLEELLLAYAGKVDVPDEDGPVEVDPVIEMDAMPSASLEASLSQGVLRGVELFQLKRKGKLDHGEAFDEAQRAIIFKIPPRTAGEFAQDVLRRIASHPEYEDYPEMRVRWERPDGREQTLTAARNESELLSEAFARIEKVDGFAVDLEAACVDIRTDLAAAMLALLRP